MHLSINICFKVLTKIPGVHKIRYIPNKYTLEDVINEETETSLRSIKTRT